MKELTFRQKLTQGLHDMFHIWKEELRATYRDRVCLSSLSSSPWPTR